MKIVAYRVVRVMGNETIQHNRLVNDFGYHRTGNSTI